MNLAKLREKLLETGAKIGFQVENETSKELTMHAELVASKYFKKAVYLRMVFFASGTIHVFLTFDKIEKTYDNFFLINRLNEENPWFRAYIVNLNNDDYLELHYVAVDIEKEEQAMDTVAFLLNEVLEESIQQYLRPILKNSK